MADPAARLGIFFIQQGLYSKAQALILRRKLRYMAKRTQERLDMLEGKTPDRNHQNKETKVRHPLIHWRGARQKTHAGLLRRCTFPPAAAKGRP